MAEEGSLERDLRKAVESVGGLCIKLPAILYRGIPDRLILLPGARICFVELKARRGRFSEPQDEFRKILFTLGFKWYMIRGRNQLEEFILVFLSKDPKC